MFGLLHTHQLTLERCMPEEGGLLAFWFATEDSMHWLAGQHGLLRLRGGAMKPFSIASAPEEGSVVIGTSLQSNSGYKRKLGALRPGDHAVFHGPVMHFTLDGVGADVVMLAQGVGVTPFRAMLRHRALSASPRNAMPPATTLVHVATDIHAFRADTEADSDKAYYPSSSHAFRSTVADVVEEHRDATYLIAGAGTFVKDTRRSLVAAGVGQGRIRCDTYYGYNPTQKGKGSADRPQAA